MQKVTKKEYKLKFKPWISREILKQCKERDNILKSISKEDDPEKRLNLYATYKTLRNEITQKERKRESKVECFSRFFEKNRNKSSEIWKGIKSLIQMKSTSKQSIRLMDKHNNLFSDHLAIANKFNDYFSTIGSFVEQKIPNITGNYKDYFKVKDKNGKLIVNCNNSLYLSPTTPNEIGNIIQSLNENKSTGPNSIPIFILKFLESFFSYWLSLIINLSFEISIFPDLLNIAQITPIYKKGCKLSKINYRPISLLSVLSKIFEKALYTRIYSHLTKTILFIKKYGFRSNYSTIHALTNLTEKLRSSLDCTHIVCGVFIDLEKAFDTVSHKILCDKLNNYGIRGKVNGLLESYLKNRKQYVSINGFHSITMPIKCGVPQGSSLGPLLFLIYINDLRLSLDKSEAGHFADDTFIIYASKNIKTIETVMNHELKLMSKWMKLNKLSINTDKTNLSFFRSKSNNI